MSEPPKKCFLVSEADIDAVDYNVAVFTTREAAEACVDMLNKRSQRNRFDVMELPLDPVEVSA